MIAGYLGSSDKIKPEPTRGLEPPTFRLQGAPSVLTMASTSYFSVNPDRFGRHGGSVGREFASQLMSRRPRRCCGLQIDPLGHHGTACAGTRARTAA
jgi:hypothetical protein